MIKIINSSEAPVLLDNMRKRAAEADTAARGVVEGIVADIRARGDKALFEYTEKFDKAILSSFEMPMSEVRAGAERCVPELREALSNAASNIRAFHQRQKRESFFDAAIDGSFLGQRVRPLRRVGLYVPGGTAAYPSSVLMNAIPAKIAGVNELIMVTPPGKFSPTVMAAAVIAGVDRVFTIGGAQAVAALAYGTESVPRVDKITGPGNQYVAEAKRQVYGAVDIDAVAGPSDILVFADDTADPIYAAADLLSQAEHDERASCILLCLSQDFAEKTAAELEKRLAELPRESVARASVESYGAIIMCKDADECVRLANDVAPEHMEVLAERPFEYIARLENVGSLFLGKYSPEPIGDYTAGPNHVLPTSGAARYFSPLSVDDFVKKSGIIALSEAGFLAQARDAMLIAEAEGLDAHARSIAVRLEGR